MYFSSDNAAPVHPDVMNSLVEANTGYASPYGADAIMDQVRGQVRDAFEAPEAAVYLTATGTSANALILATLNDPWGAIYCHRHAHIEEDECGAPEFFTGGSKLALLDGDSAKIDPVNLTTALENAAGAGVHNVQKGMLSLTNTTEHGAVYTREEIQKLTGIAKEHGLPVHMDGARIANALVATNATLAELTWKSGVAAVSFGGTKNGLMGVEAVVFFDPKHAWEFELRRKRAGHLFSKHRYLSAQMQAYLKDDLWLTLAQTANNNAKRLAAGIEDIKFGSLLHPVHANMVFASWPRSGHQKAQENGAHYYLMPANQSLTGDPTELLGARLVCSWSTTSDDVDRFLKFIAA